MESVSSQDTAHLAQRFGVSQSAVEALAVAMERGNGTMAQFNHPDLGGLGQWSRGGMLMIGDMFNDGLKAKVNEICSELAKLAQKGPEVHQPDKGLAAYRDAPKEHGNWWGEDLGYVGASGSQNHMKYAYFPASQRLATQIGDRVTIYDTGEHQIGGVSQQQSRDSSLTFTSQLGAVSLDELRVVTA